MTTDTQARYRLAAYVIALGAALLVFGYLNADQWLALVGGVFR